MSMSRGGAAVGAHVASPVDAQTRIARLIDRYAVTVRSAAGAATAMLGLLTRHPSAPSLAVLLPLLGYSLFRLAGRRRPTPNGLLALDVLVALVVALAAPAVSTAAEIRSQNGIVNAVLGAANCTLVWQLPDWTPAAWVAAVMLAHGVGAVWVPGITSPLEAVGIFFLPVQALVLWLLVMSVRRAARRVDSEAGALAETMRASQVAASRRVAEREHWAILHDTAAATLLMVGSGVPATATDRVRKQAARDLASLTDPVTPSLTLTEEAAPLPAVLREVAAEFPLGLTIVAADDVHAPVRVTHAFAAATRELLANIERHAGVNWATINVAQGAGGLVCVEVSDEGRGFAGWSGASRGIRESVCGRMERAGGRVYIDSTPGQGTSVQMWWPKT